MAHEVAHQRCFNHAGREAAAVCLSCRRYYCRECVTEHQGRVTCATCLAAMTETKNKGSSIVGSLARMGALVFSVLFLWFFFYMVGEGLMALPTSFHEGTMWQED